MNKVSGQRGALIRPWVILITLFFILVPTISNARREPLPTRYVLYGVASLEYERGWVDSDDATDAFTQQYQLGLTGPMLDPRLIAFDINGTYRDYSRDYVDDRLVGLNGTLRLFNFSYVRSRKFQFLNYLPRPITLRYSRYEGENFTSTSYSVSTRYYLPIYINLLGEGKLLSIRSIYAQPQRLKFNEAVNNINQDANRNANENATGNQQQVQRIIKQPYEGINIPFPQIYFDFDKNIYKSGSETTESTSYDARMRFGGRRYDYSLDYYLNIHEDSRSLYDRKKEALTLITRNEISSWRLENTLRKERTSEINTLDSYSLHSRLSRYFQKSPDTTYHLSFNGGYRESESISGKYESKDIGASASVSTALTPHLRSGTGLFANYQEGSNPSGEKDSFYSIVLHENLHYTGIKGLLLNGGINMGISDSGVPYGVNMGFSTTKWRRFTLSGSYQYDRLLDTVNDTDRHTHQVRYGVSALLRPNLSVNSSVGHTVSLVDNAISYIDRSEGFDVGVKWFYRKHSLNISGRVLRTYTTNPAVSRPESKIYGYRLFYNTSFMRRTLYSLSFTQDIDAVADKRVSNLNTAFSWYYGRLVFTANYEMKATEDQASDIIEQRVFLRVSRYFRRVL